jgi:hypothetical protein
MTVDDQRATIEYLASPGAHGGAAVDRIDTHGAIVFLAGSRAWKLKRAVRFDYMDFSTKERRKTMCEAEVRLNQRTAPTIYRGVVPVTRAPDGTLELNGAWPPVDWVIEMNRFDQDLLLDRLASAGRLDVRLMPSLGSAVAAFHMVADHRQDHGGRVGMQWVIEGNAAGFSEFGRECLTPSACTILTDHAKAELDRRGALLDARRTAGCVRQCHGDLHLRNIVLLDGRPTLFDAVEFNDEIACIDVMYDLAFLLMDLWRRRLPRHANAVWNSYLAGTGDWDGLPLLPLFLSCRAAVRAKTSATAAGMQVDARAAEQLRASAKEYLALAERLLHPPEPSLMAIGGLSGSGKSTLALGLAPLVGGVPGAVVLRSDEIRKRLRRASPLERLGPEAYTASASREVYATAARHAASVVGAGHSVIVDAVFADSRERDAIEGVATAASVPFFGLWLDAPETILIDRTQQRGEDASDATADVVRRQLARSVGAIAWPRIDASMNAEAVLRHALTHLDAQALVTRDHDRIAGV